jgi:hypothetical protein
MCFLSQQEKWLVFYNLHYKKIILYHLYSTKNLNCTDFLFLQGKLFFSSGGWHRSHPSPSSTEIRPPQAHNYRILLPYPLPVYISHVLLSLFIYFCPSTTMVESKCERSFPIRHYRLCFAAYSSPFLTLRYVLFMCGQVCIAASVVACCCHGTTMLLPPWWRRAAKDRVAATR